MNLSEQAHTFTEDQERRADIDGPFERALAIAAPLDLILVLAGAALVVAGFFAPWMNGDGPLSYRAFSGADFAQLIRNFEITSDTTASMAQIRASAVMLYLVPALAANAAALRVLRACGGHAAWALWSGRVAASYAIATLVLLLVLSVAPVNEFAPSVGSPSWGFALIVAGALALLRGSTARRSPLPPPA